MKKLMFFALISSSTMLFSSACSTCYECEEDVVLTDNSGNPIDTTTNSDEFCTADKGEVTAREDDGAICRVQ